MFIKKNVSKQSYTEEQKNESGHQVTSLLEVKFDIHYKCCLKNSDIFSQNRNRSGPY